MDTNGRSDARRLEHKHALVFKGTSIVAAEVEPFGHAIAGAREAPFKILVDYFKPKQEKMTVILWQARNSEVVKYPILNLGRVKARGAFLPR
jgi:hypothetical protein